MGSFVTSKCYEKGAMNQMLTLISFLHLLGAIVMGYYLLVPVVIGRAAALAGDARKGFIGALRVLNTIAQFVLIVQLLTGGYLMEQGDYSIAWMAATLVLFLLIGAFSGMMGRPMKRIMQSSVNLDSSDLGRIRLFSILVAISYLLIVIIMSDPTLLA
jgi:uncharacterized membrane protein